MMRILYIISLCLALISCERRELTYGYDPTVEVIVQTDWSNMSKAPTGMSVYCYPEDGGDPIVRQTNNTSQVSVNLSEGVYNILVFNQIPSEFGSVTFTGMDKFESAQIDAVATRSAWATTKAEADLIRNPEEVAAATYLDLTISTEDIRKVVMLKAESQETILPFATIPLTPRVVTKTTRVKVRLSAIYNYRSARATLYGMASGYHFFSQKSHVTESTHVLETWTLGSYDGYREGEIATYFTCFGLPELTTTTRSVADYEDWDGEMELDILLVDNSTVITEVIPLADKLVATSSEDTSRDDADVDVDVDVNVDINIASGFGDSDAAEDDTPIVLPDVEPVGGSESGFDATIDDWENKEHHDIEI